MVYKRELSFALAVLALASTLLMGCTTVSRSTLTVMPTEEPEEERAIWDLVLFSDSSGWGVADRYAAYIEEDLDVTVQVHDLAASGLSIGSVLAALRGESSPYPSSVDVPGLVREAEVVVIYGNPLESISEAHRGDWNCVSRTAPYARDCAAESFDAYRADLEAVYEEIVELRGDEPVLIRAFDAYNPLYSVYREQGVYDECLGCWENYNQAIHQAAAAHNVPMARVFDAFNGPDHDEDPREKGYIREDGVHTTAEGRRVITDLLRGVGYKPTLPVNATPDPTAAVESGDTVWNLVVLGDSLVAEDYSVLPEAYAAYVEEDLGIDVEIQNLATGGETTRSLLTNVHKYPWYREPLQEAEIVLISVGGGDLPRMETRFFDGKCGGVDNQDCLRQQLEESQANWDALLTEIASLTSPEETIILPIVPRVLDYYARAYSDRPADVDVYNAFVVALYEHMTRSCAASGIPVLDLYALYDGPNADPSLPEIANRGDGVHVSDEGDAVIADLLRELGYHPVSP